MGKQNMVYTYLCTISNKKEQTNDIFYNRGTSKSLCYKEERPDITDYMLQNSIYKESLGKDNL